jgi:hypothetical protein
VIFGSLTDSPKTTVPQVDALVQGAAVQQAELHLELGQATFEEVELAR